MTPSTYNFIRGMGSVMDLMPSPPHFDVAEGIDLTRSDADALRGDWEKVAGDFRKAFGQTVKDTPQHVEQKQAG